MLLVLSACTAGGLQMGARDTEAAYKAFNAHLDGCTATYGYDPRRAQGLGPFELGPNEREWRSCAYEGVRTILIPGSRSPEAYWRWIAEDRLMTDLIAQQQMTRAQRDQRLRLIQDQIAAAEKGEEGDSAQRNLDLTRGTIGILQGY